MQIRCPHCKNPFDVVGDDTDRTARCPTCGSRLTFLDDTITRGHEPARSFGHLDLLEVVGEGHFGIVWKARDRHLDRIAAVKIPRSHSVTASTVQLFMREARAAAQLRHPHIVSVYEVGQESDTVYIVSEFIQGVTLADLIDERRPDAVNAARLCATIARAIHHAHEMGIVHRDLKPGNVMIDTDGEPHVMDFGLAKREAGEITLTVSGRLLGTPAYMSPEQASGHGHHADRRSDVYSLGVILYELLTGKRPFEGETRMLVHQILTEEPRPPRRFDKTVPKDLETICLKAMAKEPEQRYQTAEEFADELQRFVDGKRIRSRRMSPVKRAWRWTHRNRTITALSAVTVAALMLLAGVAWHRSWATVAPPIVQHVSLDTVPQGANVYFVPRDEYTGEPLPDRMIHADGVSPVEVDLAAGLYLVIAVLPDGRFHEVFRRVPGAHPGHPGPHPHTRWEARGDMIVLPEVFIPELTVTEGMAPIEADVDFILGSPQLSDAPPHRRFVPSFYLDVYEVTLEAYRAVVGDPPDEDVNSPLPNDHAVRVPFDFAVAYAEMVGKRLPDEAEYEYAATFGGTRQFPWGNSSDAGAVWEFGPCGTPASDCLPTTPPVYGLFSNVAEWTCSWFVPYRGQQHHVPLEEAAHQRVVRGGSPSVIHGRPDSTDGSDGPRVRIGVTASTSFAGVGFRCARSAHPRLQQAGMQ